MIEVTGNLWTYPADIRIITTNGSLNSKGEAIMGRGCAYEASLLFPMLPALLGGYLKKKGLNISYYNREMALMTLPVKEKWNDKASLTLIQHSILMLKKVVLDDVPGMSELKYVMPRPGCGNGGRTWEEVKPLVEVLPDNFFVIDFPTVELKK